MRLNPNTLCGRPCGQSNQGFQLICSCSYLNTIDSECELIIRRRKSYKESFEEKFLLHLIYLNGRKDKTKQSNNHQLANMLKTIITNQNFISEFMSEFLK